jgi:hypothetical protein
MRVPPASAKGTLHRSAGLTIPAIVVLPIV